MCFQVRKANPEKSCFLQYDKLYIDTKIYVYNEVLGQVVEHTESVRWGYTFILLKAATTAFLWSVILNFTASE